MPVYAAQQVLYANPQRFDKFRHQESPNEMDWEFHAWTEVSLDSFKDLSDQLKESLVVLAPWDLGTL